MGIAWNAKTISQALNLEDISKKIYLGKTGDFKAKKVEFNSQEITKGDIFIALTGGKRDGHEFVLDALKKGASFAICQEDIFQKQILTSHSLKSEYLKKNCLLVDNTYEALLKLARFKRANVNSKFIAITGSVGKTSTKEFLYQILSHFGLCYVSRSNFNNHIGLPLSMASIPENTEFVVLEMGMNHMGEIRFLSQLAMPDIAIITKIGQAHIENLGNIENICRAKCEIFEGMKKDGCAIINSDSDFFDLQKNIANNLGIENILTFGSSPSNHCRVHFTSSGADSKLIDGKTLSTENLEKNLMIDAEYELQGMKYNINAPGKHNAYNLAAIFLAVSFLKLNISHAVNQANYIKTLPGRGKFYHCRFDHKDFNIIDDSYNANPTSVNAALENLSNIKGNKVVVLSDMGELGAGSIKLHESLANEILASGVSQVFTVGELMYYLFKKLENLIENSPHHNNTKESVEKNLDHEHHTLDKISLNYFQEANTKAFLEIAKQIKNNSTILVKGSNSTNISKFIDFLLKQ